MSAEANANVETKQLGKISTVSFGFGGYQDACLGLNLSFDMKGSGVNWFISGGWNFERSDHAKWTEADREKSQVELCREVIRILKEANVDDVSKLKGIPVELTFHKFNVLKSWRVLTEVI